MRKEGLMTILDDLSKFLQNPEQTAVLNSIDHQVDPSILNRLITVALSCPETPPDIMKRLKEAPLYYDLQDDDPIANMYPVAKDVYLLSGGMDSSILWLLEGKNNPNAIAVFTIYGQRYWFKELKSVISVTKDSEEKLITYNYPWYFKGDWKHIIPARNLLLLSLATKHISLEGNIHFAALNGESSEEIGDKSKVFFDTFVQVAGSLEGKTVNIVDCKQYTKNQLLRRFLDEGGEPEVIVNTITCFSSDSDKGCGKCQACARKWIALKYNNIDPTLVDAAFMVDPALGANAYLQAYKFKMNDALLNEDFSHYSKQRCIEDLSVIEKYS